MFGQQALVQMVNPSGSDNFVKEVNSTLGSDNKLKYTKGCKNNASIQVKINPDEKIHVSVAGTEVIPSMDSSNPWK